jgi:hypothetical protein
MCERSRNTIGQIAPENGISPGATATVKLRLEFRPVIAGLKGVAA